MSTPTLGRPITLLDGEHTLRFTGSALRKMERAMGGWGAFGEMPMDSVFTALWAGLAHEDPDRDVDAVADLVDTRHMEEVGKIVSEAIADAMPSAPEDRKPGKGARATRASTG